MILRGDCRDVLPTLADASVHCCATSPPYWGLRDYGTATWIGGDPKHSHVGGEPRSVSGGPGKSYTNVGSNRVFSGDCLCGARRVDAQIGLEATPDEYVAALVAVFREVRRVLRDDGTLWLNLGDSYAANRSYQVPDTKHTNVGNHMGASTPPGLKPKDLVGIPWRVAFALQADGWWLRQDIIWAKPNPMPESVTDRCTKAHEYVFLLAKAERYYYDAEAIAEPFADERMGNPGGGGHYVREAYAGALAREAPQSGLARGVWNEDGARTTRNRRSVWTVPSSPFPEAHFATFPEKLIEPCILAGCPVGGTVLDPFGGSGTTAAVAQRLGREAVLIELNESYVRIAERRSAQLGLVLPSRIE